MHHITAQPLRRSEHTQKEITITLQVIHNAFFCFQFVGNTDFGLPVFFLTHKLQMYCKRLNRSDCFMSECCIRLLKTSHMCLKIYTVWSWFPYLVWSSCHDRDPGHICAIKTRLVCVAPGEPSCKFLRGMPPAAASQREPQCKASEVTLFGPNHSVRKGGARERRRRRETCGFEQTSPQRRYKQQAGSSPGTWEIFCGQQYWEMASYKLPFSWENRETAQQQPLWMTKTGGQEGTPINPQRLCFIST